MAEMKKNVHILVGFALMAAIAMQAVAAEGAIYLSDTRPYYQPFSIGLGDTYPPTDWKMGGRADTELGTYASTAYKQTNMVAGNSYGSAESNDTCNFWDGADFNSTERAIGFLGGSSLHGGNIYADFQNTSGRAYSSVTVSYSIEKYRNGSNVDGFSMRLYYSTDGSTWTLANTTSFTADGDNNGYADAPGSTTRIDTLTINVSVANNAHLYLCWNYGKTKDSTGLWTSAQALGLDDVIVQASSQARIIFNEVNAYGTPDWIEFYVVQGGILADTIVKSNGDVDTVGPAVSVATGDYIVLYSGSGTNDAAKTDGSDPTFWEFYWSGGPTGTDDTYRLYMSGSTTIQDFVGWATQDATLNADDKEALMAAYADGQWDTFGNSPDAMDFVRSSGADGVCARNQFSTDTNSRYGWEWINTGDGTPGSANTNFRNAQGEGYWEVVTPATVTPGSSGTWEFRYRRGNTVFSKGYLTFTVPTGWTKPQCSNAGAAGYTVVLGDINDLSSGAELCITEDSTVIIAVNTLAAGESVTIVYGYGGGAAAATAPAGAGTYTFAMMSDPLGSNVSALDSSPTLTVGTPPQVILKNVPDTTLYADSRNATLLAGRVVGDASGDTLLGLTVTNIGTATSSDTADSGNQGGLSLWLDVNGDSAWDTGDSWVATLNYRGAGLWGFSSSTVLMPGGVFNFVVTTNIGATPTDGHTFQLRIGANNVQTSELGLGPAADTTNTGVQTISALSGYTGPGSVIISEISWGGSGGGAGTEWFELHNKTGTAISLNGWVIGDQDGAGCTHTFGAVTIPAYGYFLCEASEGATSVAADDIYGDDAGNLALNNAGDNLVLINSSGVTVDEVSFTSSWPAGAASGGLGSGYVSMERRDLDTAVAAGYRSNWLSGPYTVACGALGGVSGTPGAANSMAGWNSVKINEVLINDVASPDESEWVEIYNAGTTPVNIYNWELTNYNSNDKTLPQTAIPPKGFIVVHYASGTDETAFSGTNSVMHLYANTSDVLVNGTRDAVGLHTSTTNDSRNIIDFVAWAVTPGTALTDAQNAVDAGQWPSTTTQVDITDAIGRSIFRYTDGADSNSTDTGDWTQLANADRFLYSCGGTNRSNLAGTLTGAASLTVISTTNDGTGYRGAVGDTALIRLVGTDNDPGCTNTTTCTVVSSTTDGSGKVVLKLTETGLNTGIFEGYLQLRSLSSDAQWWIGCASGEIVTIRALENYALFDTIVIGASAAPGVSALLINEFMAAATGENATEYIEIYNPTDTDILIAGCYLDDINAGGSAPYQIPTAGNASDTIPARGFKVYYGATTGITLNNSSPYDDVRLLAPDGSVIDQRTYASTSSNISEGRCHDGSGIWRLFDTVNTPAPSPGATNNPAPVITQINLSSSASGRIYWNGVQDTSLAGGVVATTCTFSSSGVAQNVSITVYGMRTYDDCGCTGSDAFGDGVVTAGEVTMPYTLTYGLEAGVATQNVTVHLTDTCGASDSLTIRFVQDNTAPAAPANLTAKADTAVPDTGVWLAWSSVSGETVGYYVYVDTDGNGQAQRLSGLLTDTTGFLADSRYVTLGETYVFFVVCVDSVGNESLHSDTAQAPILIPYKLRDTVSLGGTPVPARPGATVAWRLGVRNAGFGPAQNVVITDALATDIAYKTNSADTVATRGYQATIEYSHDSGATWNTSQAAPVTNIRWTISGYHATNSIIEVKFETYIR